MRMRMARLAALTLVAMAMGASAGCDTNLVTGYQPRRLGDSPAQRRAYYAGKYSPQSHVAEQDKADEIRSRRPTGGGGGAPY
jgi:hypothetical protein